MMLRMKESPCIGCLGNAALNSCEFFKKIIDFLNIIDYNYFVIGFRYKYELTILLIQEEISWIQT